MGIEQYDEQDLVDVRFISEVISTRAACFIGTGMATLLNKMEFSPVAIGVDGTLYRMHPRFSTIMEQVTRCLLNPQIQVSSGVRG